MSADGARPQRPDGPDLRTALRYAGLQIPGQVFAALFATAAWEWFDVPGWAAAGSFVLWVVKDAVMFKFVWRSYAPRVEGGPHDPRGRTAVVEEELAPRGTVRVGAERWRARGEDGATVAPGATVRVVALEGLTLVVAPADDGADG